MVRRFLNTTLIALAGLITGCASLAPEVRGSANDYSSVMEAFSNQVLVTNVLRARDQAPLNFSDLPIIRGSIATQVGGGLSVPFGPLNASTTRNTGTSSLTFSSSPSFDTSSLNTEAFTLNLLQPVSPVYIESLWSAGLPPALLLHLFAESIQLPSDSGDAPVYFNRPDSAGYAQFVGVVNSLIDHGARLRSFTVLDPVGPPLSLPKLADSTVDARNTNALKLYTELLGLDPTRFKVDEIVGGDRAGFQIYRRYGPRIALCVSPSAAPARAGASGADDEVGGSLKALARLLGKGSPATILLGGGDHRSAAPSSPVPAGANAAGGAVGAPGKASSAQSGTNAAMTQAVQAYRVSGILDSAHCGDEEYVADRPGEQDAARMTRRFGNIRWRSTVEIYYYLGQLARDLSASPTWSDGRRTHTLFSVARGGHGAAAGITVNYHGVDYSVFGNPADGASGEVSHGLQVVSLLAQLVNIAKISNDIPKTRAFEVLP